MLFPEVARGLAEGIWVLAMLIRTSEAHEYTVTIYSTH